MTVTRPLPNSSTELIGSALPIPSEPSVAERIRTLAAQGLKVRDISSMLHIHPQMVLLLLDEVGR